MGDWRSQFPILSTTTQTPPKTLVRRVLSFSESDDDGGARALRHVLLSGSFFKWLLESAPETTFSFLLEE